MDLDVTILVNFEEADEECVKWLEETISQRPDLSSGFHVMM